MKIARIEFAGGISYALVENGGYRLMQGDLFKDRKMSERWIPKDQATLLAPVDPPQIVAIGRNYAEHAREGGAEVPAAPILFVKTINTVIGSGAPVRLPAMAPDAVDYEAELVMVIGRLATGVRAEDALDYVLGYTCGNDISARDCQLKLDKQWARGKCFDSFAPLGPWIETELDPTAIGIRSRLNGALMQDGNSRDMLFPCRYLVHYISHCMTLYPGSIIMTGTPSGVGHARTPPVFLQDGDTIEVEIDGIGTLSNPVIKS